MQDRVQPPLAPPWLRRGVLSLLWLKYKFYSCLSRANRSRPVPTSINPPLAPLKRGIILVTYCVISSSARDLSGVLVRSLPKVEMTEMAAAVTLISFLSLHPITPLLSVARKFRTPVLTCPQGDTLVHVALAGAIDSVPSLWVERLVDVAVPARAARSGARSSFRHTARCPKARPPGLGGSQVRDATIG
ncbi:hypothetical protein C8N40_10197 [Pontibacter mucosus]|uniref:Uncharacterized protein n=1 Tax=Pontibacter mucosus TaxID=1649266 RepID=A0A2T5YSI2_9BACT|nr:hypothetical protein C8N40_10197 [Pontibacter mucosus]